MPTIKWCDGNRPLQDSITKMDEIKGYFHKSAKRKATMLIGSVFLFFAGVGVSVFTM